MLTAKQLLAATVSLVILFSVAGCAMVASHDGIAKGGKENATQEEITGKVVRVTPCRTLVEVEAAEAGEEGKAATMEFFCFDAEVRESARGVEKGDTVKVQYVFSPETQRNQVKKITKVTGKNGLSVAR